ncbi:MAG: hypothetical protein E3J72_10840 [Planctomycetota bacterium]|nr:MAG: hypothetical protein E3J72_10840 [Planctomycetota bacterium]
MKIHVLLGFKNGHDQVVEFDATPAKEEDKAKTREKAFQKIVRMVMHKDMTRGFINVSGISFRIEEVAYMRLMDEK